MVYQWVIQARKVWPQLLRNVRLSSTHSPVVNKGRLASLLHHLNNGQTLLPLDKPTQQQCEQQQKKNGTPENNTPARESTPLRRAFQQVRLETIVFAFISV